MLTFSFSNNYADAFPDLPFGLATVTDCIPKNVKQSIELVRPEAERNLRERASTIRDRIDKYSRFFRDKGFRCPLPGQYEMALQKGLPAIFPYVDVLLMTELTHGLLMGIQSIDPIQGNLTVDVAHDGEEFRGMRDVVRCSTGEIVIRDSDGIIASLFQGPDKRTEVKSSSRNIVVYGFFAPGIETGAVHSALAYAISLLSTEGKTSSLLEISTPKGM